MIVFPIIYL